MALDPSARGLLSLDPRVCVSAQFLLHGSPPSPMPCLFIAQLSLLSLRCIVGKKEEEQTRGGREGERDDGHEAWVKLEAEGVEGRVGAECQTVESLAQTTLLQT